MTTAFSRDNLAFQGWKSPVFKGEYFKISAFCWNNRHLWRTWQSSSPLPNPNSPFPIPGTICHPATRCALRSTARAPSSLPPATQRPVSMHCTHSSFTGKSWCKKRTQAFFLGPWLSPHFLHRHYLADKKSRPQHPLVFSWIQPSWKHSFSHARSSVSRPLPRSRIIIFLVSAAPLPCLVIDCCFSLGLNSYLINTGSQFMSKMKSSSLFPILLSRL